MSAVPPQLEADDTPQNTGQWTKAEHALFMRGIHDFGRDWPRVARTVQTRSLLQCRTHAQKVFKAIEKTTTKGMAVPLPKSPLPCAEEILKQAPIYIPTLRSLPQNAQLAMPNYQSMVFSQQPPRFQWKPQQ
jgi:hypothetical protein